MSILTDFAAYTDSNGLVQPLQNPSTDASDNGVLYTGEAGVAYSDNSALSSEMQTAMQAAFAKCEITAGLIGAELMRNPDNSGGQEGIDDYIGCGLGSAFVDPNGETAQRILNYGSNDRCSSWDPTESTDHLLSKLVFGLLMIVHMGKIPRVYNNLNPGKFTLAAWMGRFPHLFAHLQYATGGKPNLLRRIWWSLSVLIGCFTSSSNAGSWALTWCMVRCWEKRSNQGLGAKLAVWLWRKRFSKVWGNPGAMFASYFANQNHPLAVYLKNSK
jgi:hypothetical protein